MTSASGIQDAELCGYIGVLQKRHPRTYRNTIIGSAFHAKASNAKDLPARLAALTDDERAEMDSWKPVADFRDESELGYVTLTYAAASKEFLVGLDVNGCYIELTGKRDATGKYPDQPGVLVPARVDMGWAYDHPRGRTVAIADIKAGKHEIASGARNLQFVAPALAMCDREGADWYRTGIWYARDARWEWAEPIHVGSALAAQDLARLQRAGTNPPIPVIGGHCADCFQRAHCDAFNLPVSQAMTDLAPMTKAGGLEKATPAELLKAHLLLSSMRKLEEVASDSLKAELRRRGSVVLADGKVLGLRTQNGREGADLDMVREKLPEALKRGRAYDVIHVGKP